MKAVLEMCAGRHKTPATSAVFPNNLVPTDLVTMEEIARNSLSGVTELILYVTGLSVALVTVINVCHDLDIKLILMHFDRETGNYYSQKVR